MSQWIAFDGATAALIAATVTAKVATGTGDPLQALLSGSSPAIAILPEPDGTVHVITLRSQASAPSDPITLVATGFLGLTDTPVYENSETPKTWWQKLWRRPRN